MNLIVSSRQTYSYLSMSFLLSAIMFWKIILTGVMGVDVVVGGMEKYGVGISDSSGAK